MKFGSLFAGIGGFDLGLERAGMECAWQVEIDEYCLKVLEKHWPSVSRYTDVRECGRDNLEPVDLICGGFPCQPFSIAGKRRGTEDDRYLWPEMLRVIKELMPTWVVGENVFNFVGMELDQALIDLENEDYKVEAFVLPALAFDAPHRRDRVFIVAYSKGRSRTLWWQRFNENAERLIGCQGYYGRRTFQPRQRLEWREYQPPIHRIYDGVPSRVDRLRSLGNAVVPQVAEFIGQRILEVENRE